MGHTLLFLPMLCNFLFKIVCFGYHYGQKGNKRKIFSKSLEISFVLGPSVNTYPGLLQFCLSLHFLLVLSLNTSYWLSQPVMKPYSLLWACILPWTCVWFSRFPSIFGSFSMPLFPKVSPPSFYSLTFSIFVVCLNYYILPQAIVLVHLAFSVFRECSPLSHSYFPVLREFWVRQNKDRPLESVLQGTHRHVKTA